MIRVDIIAGARPNFMKVAPIIHAINDMNVLDKGKISYRLVHTGQHYDKKMSDDFFEHLRIPRPDVNLEVGSGSQAEQTAKIMMGYETVLKNKSSDLCLVVGDVNSTMACSIVAKKAGLLVGHVEGGIRSYDMNMPEEINRMVTDSISDHFFTTSALAGQNLVALGHPSSKIHFVGNTMIDSLLTNLDRLIRPKMFDVHDLERTPYLVMTLHRPSNVDNAADLGRLMSTINDGAGHKKVVFPMHPRTKKVYDQLDLTFDQIIITQPLPYLEFIYLVKQSDGVITDSGGITEETTVLDVPCLTLRKSTERPETIEQGTNILGGTDPSEFRPWLEKMVEGNWKSGQVPDLWDGQAGKRIVDILANIEYD